MGSTSMESDRWFKVCKKNCHETGTDPSLVLVLKGLSVFWFVI